MNKLIFTLTLLAIFSIAYTADDYSNLPNTVDLKNPLEDNYDDNDNEHAVDSFDDVDLSGANDNGNDHNVNDNNDIYDLPASVSTNSQEFVDACLAVHNQYREEVGAGPLTWNSDLASGSAGWSVTLSAAGSAGTLTHSHGPYGENLSCASLNGHNLKALIDLWENEKKYYKAKSAFPDVSTTGNWKDVGHYTQLVWKDTTQVGCGIAVNDGWAYLTCRYLVQGNIHGEVPY